MTPGPNLLLVVVGVLLVGGGFLIGLALGRSSNKAERRVRELEGELETARAEHAGYRAEVSAHFGRSSELFRGMTLQYRAVYEHLADGARTLCPDKTDVLPAGGPEALLLGAAGAASTTATAAATAAGTAAAAALESADGDGVEKADTADLGATLAPVKEAVAEAFAPGGNGLDALEELETDPLPDEPAPPLGTPIRH
jgi:hypothetical protein